MSLSYRQESQLHRIEISLRQSDRHLGAMFSIFAKLYPGQDKPPWEQVPPVSSSRDRLQRAAARFVAALIAIKRERTRPSQGAPHGRDVDAETQ